MIDGAFVECSVEVADDCFDSRDVTSFLVMIESGNLAHSERDIGSSIR